MGNNLTSVKCYADVKLFIERFCKPRLYEAKFKGLNTIVSFPLVIQDMAIFYTGNEWYEVKDKIRQDLKNGKYIYSKYNNKPENL